MTDRTLLLRLFESGDAEWGLFGAAGECLRGPAEGMPPAGAGEGARVVAMVPGERVLLTEAVVPTRNPARLRRALPYAVEDRLAGDVESLHVAAGPRGEGDRVGAAVVERVLMRDWLARLDEAGLEPDALVPEPLALPRHDGGPTVLAEPGRVVVRLDRSRGWAGEPDLLEVLPPEDGRATRWYGDAVAPSGPWAADAAAEALGEPVLGLFARGLEDNTLNLLQGEFPPRRQARGAGRLWRVAAALLLAWGVLELGMAAADVWRLNRDSERLQGRIENIFTETFPGARVVDPRAQMAQKLEALAVERGDALALLRRVAPVLGAQSGLQVDSLEYRDGELTVSLKAGSLAQLDRLQGLLARSPGLSAELAAASASDRGVDGRVVIRRAGA